MQNIINEKSFINKFSIANYYDRNINYAIC